VGGTARRRAKQLLFNEAHGITPKTIIKGVRDVMEGARAPGEEGGERIAVPSRSGRVTPEQAVKQIKKLETEMLRLARNLEFEQAAKLRDQIADLRQRALGPGAAKLAG
jgi:excinuclease ABC subunit B